MWGMDFLPALPFIALDRIEVTRHRDVSAITDLVIELVRSANELVRLSDVGKRQLLIRASEKIFDLEEGACFAGIHKEIVDLQSISLTLGIGKTTHDQLQANLLDAAGALRMLHIAIDGRRA
jgi:hypothetical protein